MTENDHTPLKIRATPHGVAFDVDVKVRAKQTRITGVRTGRLGVALAAVPVDGAANEALRRTLAEHLGVSRSQVRIVSGETYRRKVVEITGMGVADVVARLDQGTPAR
jgi:uncharacterized protein (TIGR00251 family)